MTEPIEKPPRTVFVGVDAGALPELVVKVGEPGIRLVERVRVGIPDTRDHVPVVPRQAGERQRCTRRDHVQAALRVERVSQAEQVVLVGPRGRGEGPAGRRARQPLAAPGR